MSKRPTEFTRFPDDIMSNFDHQIDKKIADSIKDKPLYADYPGYNFHGKIWWKDNQWHCDVWCYGSYQDTISADTLEELRTEVCDKFGYQ